MRPVIRILVVFSLLTISTQSFGQVSFLPLDEDIETVPAATVESDGNNFWTMGYEDGIGFQNANLFLKQWNGQFWIDFPPFYTGHLQTAAENEMALCLHKNQIYAGASFRTEDNSKAGVVRWNGSKWEAVGGGITSNYLIHPEISVSDMVSYGDELLVCGDFNLTLGGKTLQNLAILQADTWRAVTTNRGLMNDMQVWHDSLFVAGKFNTLGGASTKNMGVYYHGNWQSLSGMPVVSEWRGLGVFQDQLVAISTNEAYLFDGNSWKKCSNAWDYKVQKIGSSAEFEGKLYLAGTFVNALGKIEHLLCWDGLKWSAVIGEEDVFPTGLNDYFITTRGNDLFFSGRMQSLFGIKVHHVVQLFPGRTIVKGKIYEDLNENCKWETGDMAQVNAIVSINEGQFYSSTDKDGVFRFVLPNNAKTSIRIFPNSKQSAVCTGAVTDVFSGTSDSTILLEFPLHRNPEPDKPKAELTCISGFKARHGYTAYYNIHCDANQTVFPVDIQLHFDTRLKSFQSSTQPWILDNDKAVWRIETPGDIPFSFVVDKESIQAGDSLSFRLAAMSKSGYEENQLNQVVVASLDPNAKQCNKSNITSNDHSLEYHIQFQNLGTDSAVNIHVVDTISSSLPMQYIQMLNYSHQQNYQVGYKVRDHAIIWSFKNIMLAPKLQAGEEGSSGYITFQAGLISDLTLGSIIQNQAHIYFDFQPPVATNMVRTEVVEPQVSSADPNAQLKVKPNPSNGIFTLDFSPYAIKKIEVFDIQGNQIMNKSITTVSSLEAIDISSQANGIYLIKVTHPTGVVSKKIALLK